MKALKSAALLFIILQPIICVPLAGEVSAKPCLGTIVSNGDFSGGLIPGSMPTGSVSDWSLITNTPQVGLVGCDRSGAAQMWGNLVVGESIKQLLPTPIQAGKTYIVSIRYRHLNPGAAPQDQVRFRLTASASEPFSYPPTDGTLDVIGTTPLTSSLTCVTFTFPNWTAPNNASWLTVNPENTSSVNDGAYVSWGIIDDICIVEAPPCPGNVVANGDFSAGLVPGSMPAASVSNWSLITASPQVGLVGCDGSGAAQMWGNLVVGESIKQLLPTPFQAGKTYSVSIRYKHLNPGAAPQDQVRFRLAASASNPSAYPPTDGTLDVIGTTPLTSSLTCVTYTFPNWTAPNNASWLTVNPENTSSVDDGAFVSWGIIDDICITEVCPGNIVSNGEFSTGLVYGSMPTASVNNWSLITATPQVVNTGCDTPLGAILMWGNLVVGESIEQSLSTQIQAGKIYRVTIKYNLQNPGPAPQDQVRFRLAASATDPSLYPPTDGTLDVIGTTPLTSSTTCVSYTFPDWTAPNNAPWLTVNPENTSSVNDGAFVSWGTVDDICIQVVGGPSPPVPPLPAANGWAIAAISLAMLATGYGVLRQRAARA